MLSFATYELPDEGRSGSLEGVDPMKSRWMATGEAATRHVGEGSAHLGREREMRRVASPLPVQRQIEPCHTGEVVMTGEASRRCKIGTIGAARCVSDEVATGSACRGGEVVPCRLGG